MVRFDLERVSGGPLFAGSGVGSCSSDCELPVRNCGKYLSMDVGRRHAEGSEWSEKRQRMPKIVNMFQQFNTPIHLLVQVVVPAPGLLFSGR